MQLSGTVEVGDLLLVHQTTVGTDGGAAWASAVPGRYVFRRVTALSGESATLDAPLEVGFEVPGAQAVVVAEYSQLDIEPDAGAGGASVGWHHWRHLGGHGRWGPAQRRPH
jgi:hypothetical protein